MTCALVAEEGDMGGKKYCVVSGIVFSLVALAHLLRLIYGMSVQVDEYAVPMSVSWVGVIVTAALASWAFRIKGQNRTS